jgi:histidinol-phosphate aminotransferase
LREAISQATGAHADEILVGGGIDDLMGLAIRCVLGPGDIAAATANTYPMFEYHVRGSGGRLRTVPYGDDMHVDLDRLSEMVHEHAARIVYVANPDNPSGSCRGKDAMERFLTALPESTLLLLDEAYNEFVGQQEERKRVRHRTLRDPANVVRLRTFSKGYGLAGLHVGYLVAPAHYVDAIGKVRTQHGVNRVAQAAAQAALSDVAHLQTVIRMTGKMRAMYADMGRRHRWRPLTSHTNFVTFDVGSATRARWLVETLSGRGVFVRGGQAPPVKGYVRVTIGTDDECRLLDEALTSLPRENARM